jgi:hypothetical protein
MQQPLWLLECVHATKLVDRFKAWGRSDRVDAAELLQLLMSVMLEGTLDPPDVCTDAHAVTAVTLLETEDHEGTGRLLTQLTMLLADREAGPTKESRSRERDRPLTLAAFERHATADARRLAKKKYPDVPPEPRPVEQILLAAPAAHTTGSPLSHMQQQLGKQLRQDVQSYCFVRGRDGILVVAVVIPAKAFVQALVLFELDLLQQLPNSSSNIGRSRSAAAAFITTINQFSHTNAGRLHGRAIRQRLKVVPKLLLVQGLWNELRQRRKRASSALSNGISGPTSQNESREWKFVCDDMLNALARWQSLIAIEHSWHRQTSESAGWALKVTADEEDTNQFLGALRGSYLAKCTLRDDSVDDNDGEAMDLTDGGVAAANDGTDTNESSRNGDNGGALVLDLTRGGGGGADGAATLGNVSVVSSDEDEFPSLAELSKPSPAKPRGAPGAGADAGGVLQQKQMDTSLLSTSSSGGGGGSGGSGGGSIKDEGGGAAMAAMRAVLGEGPTDRELRRHLALVSGDVQAALASYFGD